MELLYDNNRRFMAPLPSSQEVLIWDETLRDGEQTPGLAFHPEEKVAIARLLAEAGVGVIDAGMPIISEDERLSIKAILDLALPCEVGVTVRSHETDLRLARDCGVRDVYMFLSVSPLHMACKFGMRSREELHDVARRHLDLADRLGLRATFIAEDSTGTDPEDLLALFAVVRQAGVRRVIICDTAVRMPSPLAFYEYVRYLRAHAAPDLIFGIHCHNDLGCANANTILAVLAGVTVPTVTVTGIGERAGNAPLEQTAVSLEKMGIRTGIKLEKLYGLTRLLQRYSGVPVAMHAPVVGLNAFRHESGIHAAGVLEDPRTYETILPEEVGREREIIFGKHSGRHQLEALLQSHGIPHAPPLIDVLLQEIKAQKEHQSHRPLFEMLEELERYYRTQFGIPIDEILQRAREMNDDERLYANAA